MIQHYKQLHSALVKSDEDEGIFTDTFLKLTYNFNPEELFAVQFRYYFSLLKGAYRRDSKASSFLPLDEDKIAE